MTRIGWATMVELEAPASAPWYWRLFVILKLPYDLIRFVVTGKLYMGYWEPRK